MIQPAVFNIILKIVSKLPKIPRLNTVILYGSAARDEITDASDIDLLLIFDTPYDPETSKELEIAHQILGAIDINRRIQIVACNTAQNLDPVFLDNVYNEGIVIFGKPALLTPDKLQLKSFTIYTYSVGGLPQTQKSKLQRALAGYKVTKVVGEKEYVTERIGLIEELDAKRLGKGVVMVTQEHSKAFEDMLDLHKVKYTKMQIWAQTT